MEKRKLELMALTGSEKCFLEIEVFENGDMNMGMRGQNKMGEVHDVGAQIPNPVNAGGNPANYKILRKIYDVLGDKK